MKLLIPILFICNMAYSQADVFEVIKSKANVSLYANDSLAGVAKKNALAIMASYQEDDHGLLQTVVDGIDNSWFSDLDVFLGDDLQSTLKAIQSVKDAYFIEHEGRVLIDVSETNELCLITIYTIL